VLASKYYTQDGDREDSSVDDSNADELDDLGIDIHEFLFPLVLVSQGDLPEKMKFLFSRFDSANIGWINSVAVFILLATCIKGLNRLLTMHTPSLRMLQDFLRKYAPSDDRWTVKTLCDALKQDPYASKCVESIQVTHSSENAKQQAAKLWQGFTKSMQKRIDRMQHNQQNTASATKVNAGGGLGMNKMAAGLGMGNMNMNMNRLGGNAGLGMPKLGKNAVMNINKNHLGDEHAASKLEKF